MSRKKPRKDSIFTYLNVYQGAGPPSMKYTKSSYQQPIVVPHKLPGGVGFPPILSPKTPKT